MNRAWTIGLATLLFAPVAALLPAGRGQESADDLYYRAFHQEAAQRDFEKAAALYAQALAALAKEEPRAAAMVSVRCRVGRARCLAALGRATEAEAELARALELAPRDRDALAELARLRAPEALAPGLSEQIAALVGALDGTGKQEALDDLVRMGAVTVPQLSQALRDVSIGRVAGAARALALIDTAAAWDAIGQALRDPRLLYPKVVVEQLDESQVKESAAPAWRAAAERSEPELREHAAWQISELIEQGRSAAEWVADLLVGLARDPAPEVRRTVFARERSAPEIVRALVPVVRTMLASAETEERRLAAGFCARNSEALPGEMVAEIERAQRDDDAQVRGSTFRAVIKRHRDGDPRRAAAAALRMVLDPHVGIASDGAVYLSDSRTSANLLAPEARGDLMTALRRLVEEPGFSASSRKLLATLLAAPILQVEDLIEIYARVGGAASQCAGADGAELRRWIAQRLLARADRGSADAWVLAGLEQIPDGPGRALWLERWESRGELLARSGLRGANDPDPDARYTGYRILGFQGRRIAPEKLTRIGVDLDAFSEKRAEKSLARIDLDPDPSLAPEFRRAAARYTGNLRNWALKRLVDCAGAGALDDLRRELVTSLGHGRFELIGEYAALLGDRAAADLLERCRELGPSKSFHFVQSMVDDNRNLRVAQPVLEQFVRGLPAEGLTAGTLSRAAKFLSLAALEERLAIALQHGDRDAQLTAIRIAGEEHVEGVWERLGAFLDSADGALRDAATEALQRIRDYRALRREFGGGLDDGRRAAFEKAKGLLASSDALERGAAALALGALGDVAAVPLLLDLMKDSDHGVRTAAWKALERLNVSPPVAPPRSDGAARDSAPRRPGS